jgi:hypothetical protein
MALPGAASGETSALILVQIMVGDWAAVKDKTHVPMTADDPLGLQPECGGCIVQGGSLTKSKEGVTWQSQALGHIAVKTGCFHGNNLRAAATPSSTRAVCMDQPVTFQNSRRISQCK